MKSNHKRWTLMLMVILLVVIGVALSLAPLASAVDQTKLIGTWKLVSFDAELQETGELNPILGKNPKGYLIFTPEGRAMTVFTAGDRKAPKTDEERAAAFTSMYAYSGLYRIEGDKMTWKLDVSWNEAWTVNELVRSLKLEGDRLKIISAWMPSTNPRFHLGKMVRAIITWERVK
ncbi:MAG: lipocalin-like domain-containing protein [Rubrivivax sp.]|nr:lipocalin-like domain-containing protein [Rubrivivax sp.]